MYKEPSYEKYGKSSGPLCQSFELYTGTAGTAPGTSVQAGLWNCTEFLKDMNIEIDAGGVALDAVVQLFGSNNENAPGTEQTGSEPLLGTQIGSDIDVSGNMFIPVPNGPYRFVRLGIKTLSQGAIKAHLHGISG